MSNWDELVTINKSVGEVFLDNGLEDISKRFEHTVKPKTSTSRRGRDAPQSTGGRKMAEVGKYVPWKQARHGIGLAAQGVKADRLLSLSGRSDEAGKQYANRQWTHDGDKAKPTRSMTKLPHSMKQVREYDNALALKNRSSFRLPVSMKKMQRADRAARQDEAKGLGNH